MKYHIVFDLSLSKTQNPIRLTLYNIKSNLTAGHFLQNFNRTLFAGLLFPGNNVPYEMAINTFDVDAVFKKGKYGIKKYH
jgi:hypothetical protein